MRVLLHMCCANCALIPLKRLRDRRMEITGFWFNPNIHPFEEYRLRLGAVKTLQELWGLDVRYHDEYGLTEYLRNVVHHEDERCLYCYTVRLEETAVTARQTGADAFTTTLLVSPYQKFETITRIGRMMQERHRIEFLAEDFRDGFRNGMKMSKDLGLYRQKYCGCIYSEMEKHMAAGRRNGKSAVPNGNTAWSRSADS